MRVQGISSNNNQRQQTNFGLLQINGKAADLAEIGPLVKGFNIPEDLLELKGKIYEAIEEIQPQDNSKKIVNLTSEPYRLNVTGEKNTISFPISVYDLKSHIVDAYHAVIQ